MKGTKVKQKRVKKTQNVEEKCDFLSQLPDSLLQHILSYITMKDVIRTSVLSKRWRYIWLYVPCLTFLPLMKIRSKQVAFITQSLLLHKAPKVEKLDVAFGYSQEAHLVDSWIQFALTRNVNRLHLELCQQGFCTRQDYSLPHVIFNCSSLTVLSLKGCSIELPVKFRSSSLKSLSFEEVKFNGRAVNDLLSSCPLLENLSFTNCNLTNYPNLIILNAGVKALKIQDYSCTSSALEIYAPFIVSFEIIKSFYLNTYVIKRMESLKRASFVCSKDPCRELSKKKIYPPWISTSFIILENLVDLCHVKDLRMCSCYIEAMSSTEHPSQDLRGEHILNFVSFDVKSLWIKTGLRKWELPGIAYILSHAPNITTLLISIDDVKSEERDKDEEYWQLQEPNFVGLLCSLKTVKVMEPNFVGLLCSLKTVKVRNLMKNLNALSTTKIRPNDMNFLRFLLKNSNALEILIFATCKNVNLFKSERKKLKLMFDFMQELLAFPRASPYAEISFC